MSGRVHPVRLRLSRAKGFDLEALSRTTNGLDVVNCARPGFWGNLFSVHPQHEPGRVWGMPGAQTFSVPTVEDAVACFEEMMAAPSEPGQRAHELREALPRLTGRNLACWCPLPADGEPDCCHAAVLLRLANDPAATPSPHSPRRDHQEHER